MLRIEHIDVGYTTVPVIKDMSLEIRTGEVVALIGANGAGKTTTLRAISGLIKLQSGKIFWGDKNLADYKSYQIVSLGISHVPERRGIFANLTVLENLQMGGFTQNLSDADYEEVYALFPRVKERLKQIAGTLSGGEQQMLAISRALLSKPQLLILDEPSLGLAPQITKVIFDTIKTINQKGTTVLLVEQNARAALKVSHRGYVLEVGEIAFEGSSEYLLNNDRIRKAYLGD
jgi:branched-chain amino acid transport system ATP-binding protein